MPPACDACGAVLTPDSSPAGLCPACLFAQVLSDAGDTDPSEASGSSDMTPASVFGSFRIEAVLGKGGMSTVYRAHEAALDRVVALKVLPPEFLHDETFARRFQQEARVVAGLEHPHIVPLYASGIEDGVPWMSMRLMTGGSLETLVAGGRLDGRRTVEILQAVASALDYAHARGVVHRDVKPSNILLDRAGHVCVADFGLAHLMERSLVRTRTGVIAGTPHYMAPEQGLGREVDHRTDIYSLGVVAYELLTGRPPFDAGSPVAILMKHASEPLPVPEKGRVSNAVVPVLRKALAKQAGDRWPTATAFVSALEESVAAPPVVPARRIWPIAVWATGLAAAGAIGVVVLRPATTTETEPEIAVEDSAQRAPATPVGQVAPPEQVEAGTSVTDAARPPVRAGAPVPSDPTQPMRLPTTVATQPAAVQPAPVQRLPARSAPVPEATQPAPPAPPAGLIAPEATTIDTIDEPAVPQTGAAAAGVGRASRGRASAPSDGAAPEVARPATAPRSEETIAQPVRVQTVSPTYPPLALAAQIEGDVVLEAVVGPDGQVTDVSVVRSVHPLLDDAARQAVREYVYKPGLRNGVPDTFRVEVTVSFKIQ